MDATPTVLLWSGGKDAALALDALRSDKAYDVAALLTTVVEPGDRVTMHGVGLPFIERQAEALSLPLEVMRLPEGAPNDVYEARLEEALAPLEARGFSAVVAGDLHLEDVRAYRETLLRRLGFEAVFPIWQEDTSRLARRFIERGYRAVVTSVDTEQLSSGFVGRAFDEAFLADLPEGVDPCGENGEFHTFVFDGPPFAHAVSFQVGAPYQEGQMCYARLDLG